MATLVEALEACEFETIVCTDPHSYNIFTNEYPEIDFEEFADDPMLEAPIEGYWNEDGEIAVKHYTQLVQELIAKDRLEVPARLEYAVTYHDPYHLGRYDGKFEAPRELVAATGAELHEMPRNRADSFCCGGRRTLVRPRRGTEAKRGAAPRGF